MNDASRPGESAQDAITFRVSDMSCGHCVGAIKAALEESIPGTPFAIDLEHKHVIVSGNEAAAAEAIKTAGYTPERIV